MEARIKAQGQGAKQEIAEILGVVPSNISKILIGKSNFDRKTAMLYNLILQTKSEDYKSLPVVSSSTLHGYVMEKRDNGTVQGIYTWRPE